MNKNAFDTPFSDLGVFLTTSRQYLGLNATDPNRPACAVFPAPLEHKAPAGKTATQGQGTSMKLYRHLAHRMLLAAGLGAFLAGPVVAEMGCPQMGGHEMHQEQYAKQMEQHHKQLHDALKLMPGQEPAWKTLMDTEQAKIKAVAPAEDGSRLTTPERAEKMLEISKARQEQKSLHVAALKSFYAMLSDEQKKVFEDFHAASRTNKGGKPKPGVPKSEKVPAKP